MKAYRTYLEKRRAKNTVRIYVREATRFLRFLKVAGIELAAMPPNLSDAYIQYLNKKEGKKAATCQMAWSAVQDFLSYLRREGHNIQQLPFPVFPQATYSERPFLDVSEVRRALDLVRKFDLRKQAAFAFLIGAGLRISELTTLRLSDISIRNGTMYLSIVGKGAKPRVAPVFRFVYPQIQEYLRYCKHEIERSPKHYIFPSGKSHLTDRAVQLWTVELADMMGKKFSPHAFRHSYISMLNRMGVSDLSIAVIVGHASVDTTKVYTHVDADMMKDVVDKVEQIWQGNRKPDGEKS